ncbi:MAG: MBOAT family protein [Kiritimatiellae bacterium]|nr:MBOAT family protein [Kiritimatiellia bacterium]
MLFNSFEFFLLLIAVLAAVRIVGPQRIRLRNAILLGASYVFYGWWDWRFLSLIAVGSALDYGVGLGLERWRSAGARRALLAVSLMGNLGVLGVFKYADFFLSSLRVALAALGVEIETGTLELVLPVGISFYTFQKLGYVLEVAAGRMLPVRDPLAFFTFVSFFPQLVAGPIERAGSLLPQFLQRRDVREADVVTGLRWMLLGLWKKVVVADRLAAFVDAVYAQPTTAYGARLLLATCAFGVQIYGDFSGYSDIARGAARLLGFDLMENFRRPYLAADIRQFWSRWHISLSSWFRDYVYIPLGGNRRGRVRWALNVVTVFALSGLWHGANWTFVLWGLLHAGYLIGGRLLQPAREWGWRMMGPLAVLRRPAAIGATWALVSLGWVLFRAPSVADAAAVLRGILGLDERAWFDGVLAGVDPIAWAAAAALMVFEAGAEWLPPRWRFEMWPAVVRWAVYGIGALTVMNLGAAKEIPFIYFQF